MLTTAPGQRDRRCLRLAGTAFWKESTADRNQKLLVFQAKWYPLLENGGGEESVTMASGALLERFNRGGAV